MRIRHILPSFVLPLCLLILLFGVSAIQPAASSQGKDEVTAARFAAALYAQKQADAKLKRGASAEQRFQELSAKLQSAAGTVRVIVRLNVAFSPEGGLQQAERLAQRAAISQAQDAMINSVLGGVPASFRRYKSVPYFAAALNAAELAAVEASPLALDIQEDIPVLAAQTQAPSLSLIGASTAWSSGYNGAGRTIAILDSGVDKTHPALAGKVIREACFSTDDPDHDLSSLCQNGRGEGENAGLNCTGMAGCDHGTSVAGVVAGVAPGASLISIQVNSIVNSTDQCGDSSPCISITQADLIDALDYVSDLLANEIITNMAAVNVSLARDRYTGSCDSLAPKDLIENLRSFNVATVIASGNEGYDDAVSWPACISTAVSVGATGDGQSLAADEVAPYSNSLPSPDFTAPILLAPGYYPSAPVPGTGTTDVWGTSIAAAHVSGAWAILKQQSPEATVFEVLNKLTNSGILVTDSGNSLERPRIKIDAALDCIQNVPENRWKGEYFNNRELTGDPVMARDDGGGFLNVNFGAGSPNAICGPGADDFSVRWTRKVNFPTTDVYRFIINADDGVRLYVDGVKQFEMWNTTAGPQTKNVLLDARDHIITLEMQEFGGLAYASLSWDTPCIANVPAGNWKGEYFRNTTNFNGTRVMVRDDGAGFLDFNWGSGGPNDACMVGVDNFSVRWTRSVFFNGGPWRFTVSNADDGVRLYIDGGLPKIDRWVASAGTNMYDMELSATNHDIKLEYFEGGGSAGVGLSWAPAPPNPPSNLAATVISPTQINLSWIDHSNFESGFKIERWNGSSYVEIGSVGASAGSENVATYPNTGLTPGTTYLYRVRAYNSVGVSNYSESSATTLACSYEISPNGAWFNEAGGSGSITVSTAAGCSWSAASGASWIGIFSGASGVGNGIVGYNVQFYTETNGFRTGQITIANRTFDIIQDGPPEGCTNKCCTCLSESSQRAALDTSVTDGKPRGLMARYFDNTTLSGQPVLQRTDAIVNFDWAGARPDASLPADRFSARWSGKLSAPKSEAYTFYLYSDDGAKLWVNNRLVIDRWKSPFEPQTRSAPVELKAGEKADIRLEYYNASGQALIQLLWSSASARKQIIPQRYLYPEAATDNPTPTDTNKQTGMLLPPGSDAGPKARWPQQNVLGRWLVAQFSHAGLVLLIAGCVLALLLPVNRRQSRGRSAMTAVYTILVLRFRKRMNTAIGSGAESG